MPRLDRSSPQRNRSLPAPSVTHSAGMGRGSDLSGLLVAGDGPGVVRNELISWAFVAYYQELYQADPLSPRDQQIPCLSLGDQDSLDAEVTCDKLCVALAQLQPGKALGTNGFLAEYWCLVWPQVGSLLLDMLQEGLLRG
ncbi:hypothetical protein NDU88_006106 [Pleurodeles waltl]|uniref:Uncharacterized protein n=1 Tax=Pleurodeles waltl TaxID=8319 RepID=A0AAV7TVV4_PLEWA|nr:hypothetical protein NDU88_006106 [Pleurodeles waltl]